jgi:hypothetical protein
MPRTQRIVQYIQQLAYENVWQQDERDERPADFLPPSPTPEPKYAAWNATSFASYVPFGSPTNS